MTPEQRDKLDRLLFEWRLEVQRGRVFEDFNEALVAFIDSLPAPPWTSEMPTVGDRWYWWRAHPSMSGEVVLFRNGLFYRAGVEGHSEYPFAGQWSGPLQEPQGEKA